MVRLEKLSSNLESRITIVTGLMFSVLIIFSKVNGKVYAHYWVVLHMIGLRLKIYNTHTTIHNSSKSSFLIMFLLVEQVCLHRKPHNTEA